MATRCVALLGPGLDGRLAIALLRQQGIDVIAATLSTVFTPYTESIAAAARMLEVPLVVLPATVAYFDRIRHPRFGYTRELAPCLDCRVHMLIAAGELLTTAQADFIVTGDVVGQRLPGQSKRDFALVDFHAQLEGRVLRPLSARLLPETAAELTGRVDRQPLLALQGRGRQAQLRMARDLGWSDVPAVTSGCLLADAAYAHKLSELLQHRPAANDSDFTLLRMGRHVYIDNATRAILGRNAGENAALAENVTAGAIVSPQGFIGPTALVLGNTDEQTMLAVVAQIWRHRKVTSDQPLSCAVTIKTPTEERAWSVEVALLPP